MTANLVVCVLGVLATVAMVVYFLTAHTPEETAGHDVVNARHESRSDQLYALVGRPAGPDAEEQRVDDRDRAS